MTANDSSEQICVPSTKEEEEEEEWSVSCSDDEKYRYNPLKSKTSWEPPPDVIADLYKVLDEKGIINLEWICPDRRSPTPPPSEMPDMTENKEDTGKDRVKQPDEFDFDLGPSHSVVTPRRLIPGAQLRQLRGSGQKRTASLKNVMSDIRRHQKLEAKESKIKTKEEIEGQSNPNKSADPYGDMDF